jgi:tetratricopeptide (TPR) repeat protein
MKKASRVAIAVLVGWLTGGAAAAGPREEAAREAVTRGSAAYNLGRYDEAARHYEDAYTLVQDPILLFNLGQAYRLGGKPDKALTAYRAFLRTAPPDAVAREQAQRRARELEASLAEERRRAREAPAPLRPAPTTIPRAAPPAIREPAPLPAMVREPAPPAPSESPFYTRAWFWTVVAGVVAVGAGGGVLYARRPTEAPLPGNAGVATLR